MKLYNKKYLSFLLFIGLLLIIPIILNFVLQIPSHFPIIGDSQTWLSFWASYIGAIASFAMIAVTFLTLKQNQAQLNEIKRQWEEEHRPHLVCRIIVNKKAFILQISNPSQFDASFSFQLFAFQEVCVFEKYLRHSTLPKHLFSLL